MTNRSSIQATSSQSLLDSLICNEILEEEENEEIIFDESNNLERKEIAAVKGNQKQFQMERTARWRANMPQRVRLATI